MDGPYQRYCSIIFIYIFTWPLFVSILQGYDSIPTEIPDSQVMLLFLLIECAARCQGPDFSLITTQFYHNYTSVTLMYNLKVYQIV